MPMLVILIVSMLNSSSRLSTQIFLYIYSNEKHPGESDWLSGSMMARLVEERCDYARRFLIGPQGHGVKRTL